VLLCQPWSLRISGSENCLHANTLVQVFSVLLQSGEKERQRMNIVYVVVSLDYSLREYLLVLSIPLSLACLTLSCRLPFSLY